MLKKSLCLVLGFMCIGEVFGSVSVPSNSFSPEELNILQVIIKEYPDKVKNFLKNNQPSDEYKVSEDGRTILPGDSVASESTSTQPVGNSKKKHKKHKKNRKNNVSVAKQTESSISTSPDTKDEKYDLDEVTEQLKKWQEEWVSQRKEIVRALENFKEGPVDYFQVSIPINKEYEEKLKSEEEEKPYMPMLYWNSWEGDWNFNSKSVNSFEGTKEDLQNIDLSEFSNDDLKKLLDVYITLEESIGDYLYYDFDEDLQRISRNKYLPLVKQAIASIEKASKKTEKGGNL